MVIDHILENTPANFVRAAADMNNDGDVDVTDVGLIIDLILSDEGAAGAKMRISNTETDALDPQ